ncbi:MAG: sulfate transporter, inner rane subunit [Pseudomonadota bacterium]|jgi:sulfate transport system permease protein
MQIKSVISSNSSLPMASQDSNLAKYILISISIIFLGIFLILPLVVVFKQALEQGWNVYIKALSDSEALSAIKLTLLTLIIVLPLNTIFGLFAAWCLSKFIFKRKALLMTLIDLPFSISPIVVGLMYVLLFGRNGWFGEWLINHDFKVIFALPGIVLGTLFVTMPFVARELLALMQTQGKEEEEASIILGANGLQTFWYVTLPNIKWSLLYGIILCSARAIGEFGAVSVLSGHIRNQTNTVPLHIEILYNEYNFTGAFAVASLLTILALITLIIKNWLEHMNREDLSPINK